MFRHSGEARTIKHNLRIASLLSFVAGIVNITGFLAVQRLTTNVTGHFAYFIDEIFKQNFWEGFIYFLFLFFFFLGSFTSSLMVELISRKSKNNIYVIPAIIESLILLSVAVFGELLVSKAPNVLAFLLLFSMGLQNSLVTQISNSIVRTTHLTGLFTDLGIELSQLFFYKQKDQKQKLLSSIRLRLTIISFFLLGGLLGGLCFSSLRLYVLVIAGLVLLIGIIADTIKNGLLFLKQRFIN